MKISLRIGAVRAAVCLLAAWLGSGCAATTPRSQRFIHRAPAGSRDRAEEKAAKAAEEPPKLPQATVEQFIAQVRALSTAVRPRPAGGVPTIEAQDPELTEARLILAVMPSAENHRRVAAGYLRLGVLDAAYDHYRAALRLEPTDPVSFDGLARVWRDWGLPNLGLGDAHRAIYYAPSSPTVYNTLGTLLQQLGQTAEAQSAFEAALRRDPEAPFALNNLCYAKLMQGHSAQAVDACRHALRVQPELAAARNNLGLALWADGDRTGAAAAFDAAGSPGAARFNTGLALLASRDFAPAAQAFDEATALSPALTRARPRARQARTLADAAPEKTRERE
jgi:tetratricopeptide (TPR) repeat protein